MWRGVVMSWLAAALAPGLVWSAETDAERFAQLFARKTAIISRFQTLQQTFRQAKPEERQKLAEEFEKLKTEFQTKVFPQLSELAPKVYAADRKNFDAGETALEMAFQQNRYENSAKIADQLLADGHQPLLVRNIAGASHFAIHEFDKAHEILTAAEKDGELHPQLGGAYLESSVEYAKFWEQEQAIREQEAAAEGDAQLPRVKFQTNRGDIVMELFENEAPNTVANFISLIESKQYDGVKFHRVIPNFMAQGGDPLSKDKDPTNDGTGGPGYTIKCECWQPNARMHFRGSLSMAHAGRDTGGSQFFITHLPTAHLNPNPDGPSGHTVFGRVVSGLDIAAALQIGDVIESATVLRKRKHPYKPETAPEK
jgi:cyclophilin family peptidyl-prolyl cis-trans isomerase